MAFAGHLGSADSRLGNIVLALGASRSRRFRRPAGSPRYRVIVREIGDTTFAPGNVIAEFDRVQNLAYGDWANSVPEAFFTIHQDDPKGRLIRDKGGRAHVEIWREDDDVWRGWLGLERDANSDDAILYCYGYLADTFWLHTGWKAEWLGQTVGHIAGNTWAYARDDVPNSRLQWISTGTVEAPLTTAGGSTELTLSRYEAYHKRVLFLLQEMAALGASDTGQATIFEITHGSQPAFNFWKDRSRDLTDVRWEWDGSGRGKVQGFREYVMPVYHRNFVYGVGQNPRTAVLRKTAEDTVDQATWGRMEEALFFSWVRDETELDRSLKHRIQKALQHDHQLTLSMFPGAEIPPNTSNSQWRIGDTVPVLINRGVSIFDGRQQIAGYMVTVEGGNEFVRPVVQEPL